MAQGQVNTNPWNVVGINYLPLEDSAKARLVVTDTRGKISSLAGPDKTAVAAVIETMQGSTIEGLSWAVWGLVGVPDLDTCQQVSRLTDKGKPKLKLAVPDLSNFEFNTSSDDQKNCSEWQDGAVS